MCVPSALRFTEVGFYAVTVEFMLSAILKQELDRDFSKLEQYVLCLI